MCAYGEHGIPEGVDPMSDALPLIALTVGDPAGIGPEIVLEALEDNALARRVRLLVIGPAALRPAALPNSGVDDRPGHRWLETPGPDSWTMGEAQESCGAAALAALREGVRLARAHQVAALVTAPVCKEALHLAGEKIEGQTELLARLDETSRFEMIGLSGKLRVMLLTRHLPLSEAIASITTKRVVQHLELFDEALRGIGIEHPRIALAGLNPHAGEGGILGREEQEILEPGVQRARAAGIDVLGPRSPDTVFLEASEGDFDGVLALYHDQAFIPLKLLSHGTGVTWIAGLSFLRLSPVHGTAFDIAGKGVADASNLLAAIGTAADWCDRPEGGRALLAQPRLGCPAQGG